MADLSQVMRWQSGFVRGLAQSVLERARAIRSSLPVQPLEVEANEKPQKKVLRKPTPPGAAKRSSKAKKVSGV